MTGTCQLIPSQHLSADIPIRRCLYTFEYLYVHIYSSVYYVHMCVCAGGCLVLRSVQCGMWVGMYKCAPYALCIQ